jgi:hypothetical protein
MIEHTTLWARRVTVVISGVEVATPCLEDLISTKKFGARPRDADDIRWLQNLQAKRRAEPDPE